MKVETSPCHNRRILTITPGEVNTREVLRYAKCKDAGEVELRLIDECVRELGPVTGRVVAQGFAISIEANPSTDSQDKISDATPHINLGFCELVSRDLSRCLDNCEAIILFAATIGMEIDRLIRKYSHISPAKALIYQALGAERIEAVCDEYCRQLREELKAEGLTVTPRFSPGYGDVGLELQRDIFRILEPMKTIGISLGENLFMTPSKSVTAIVGVKS